MAQDPWEDFPAVQQTQRPSTPIMGARPTPKDPTAPREPKTNYRPLSPQEAKARGLPDGGSYQISSEGKVDVIKAAPDGGDVKTPAGQKQMAKGILAGAGVKLDGGVDPVADLIKGSTSGSLQRRGAEFWGSLTGDATDGMENIGRLKVIGNDMVLTASGGSLGAQISNSDRDFMAARFGDIANPDLPMDQRLAAWDQVKKRLGVQAGEDIVAPASGKVNIPTIKGGLPEGTQVQFGMDKWGEHDKPFDRTDYIQRRYGVTPDQEDWIVAFWNGNRQNPALTPDGVKQAFTEAGIPAPDDAGIQEGISNAQQGFEFSAFNTSQAEQEYRDRLNKMNVEAGDVTSAASQDRTSAAGYINRAYTGLSRGLSDEIRGLDAAGDAIWAGQNPLAAYAVNRDAERQLQEQSRNEQGVMGWVAEIGGSIPTALLAPGALSRNVGQAAKAGAIVGAVDGFGRGDGLAGSGINALVGAGLGAVTGGAVQGGLNRLASRAPRPNAMASDARQVVDAGAEWNVPVKTSDVRPPQTPAGRTARLTGEMIPIAGTGGGMGGRATQQASREEAVQRFVKEFGGDPTKIDDVTADLVATRGKELSTLTRAKDSVIDGISDSVPPAALRNTLRTIDTQISILNKANTEAFAPVVSKMENFRNTLASGKTLREVDMNRALLGELFADPSLASIKGAGQKALNKVYAPLREDMGAFIESKAGSQARSKWKGANDRLSAMAGELDDKKFKNVLNQADTTPERVAPLLFSKTPSEVRRLVGGLSEKGKIKARSAIIYQAAKDSTADDVISPDKFKQAMMAMDSATGVVFSKNDKTRIDGFVRLLEATQRAKIANTEVMTGARSTGYIAGYGLSQIFGNMTIPASAGIGLLARGYESTAFRNLMMNLGKAKKGSPAEAAVGRKVYDYITRAGITPGTPANDVAAERLGSMLGNPSTTAAAAGEQEQN